jgi:hypothetical protein
MLGARAVAAHAVLHRTVRVVATAAECAAREVEAAAGTVLRAIALLLAESALALPASKSALILAATGVASACVGARLSRIARSRGRALIARATPATYRRIVLTRTTASIAWRRHAGIVTRRASITVSCPTTAWRCGRCIGQTCLELIATRGVASGCTCLTRLECVEARLGDVLCHFAARAQCGDTAFRA